MKSFIKNYWKIIVFFGLVGLFGGYFTGIYMYDTYPAEIIQEMNNQGITVSLVQC